MKDKFNKIRDYVYDLIKEKYPEIDLASNKELEQSIIEDLSSFSKVMTSDELTNDNKAFLDDYVYDNNELYTARCDIVKEIVLKELAYDSICLDLVDEKEINAMVEDVIEYADNENIRADDAIYDGYFSEQIDEKEINDNRRTELLIELGKDKLNSIMENCSIKEIVEVLNSFEFTDKEIKKEITNYFGENDKEIERQIDKAFQDLKCEEFEI